MIASRSTVTLFALFLAGACVTYEPVPETGRRRPKLQYSEAEMARLGEEAYAEILADYRVVTGTDEAAMVTRVGQRLARASGKAYDWEFKLLDAPDSVNAFCLPGGKVGVFSGILPISKSEDGLAVVLGHEIAHATLQHANERMSQPALKRLVGLPVTLGAEIWGAISPHSRKLVMGAFGLGHLVGEFLPYSQEHELEADEVGLRYVQAADYDIHEAPVFWDRMAASSPADQPYDELSTHPDPERRAQRLRALVREMDERRIQPRATSRQL